MKTRLLLFLLFAFSLGNAQVISYNDFESTTVPAGWNYGSFTPNTTEVCNGATTLAVTLSQGAQAEIRSPLYNFSNNLYILAVNFKKTANIKLSIQRSLDDVTWQNIVESYASTCTELVGNLGMNSSGTVRFRILVLNDASTPMNVSTYIDDFTFAGYEVNYTFNNTRKNSNTFQPFTSANTSFINDRNAVPNSALNIAASPSGTYVTLNSLYQQLPSGNSPRTISFWYKVGANVNNTSIFAYGPLGATTRFGMYIQGTGRPVFWAGLPDPVFGTGSFAADTWHHAVLTYDGANISIYMNGVLQATKAFALNTTFGDLYFFNGSTSLGLDDLKIYNYAVSQTEVTNLFNNNSLTNPLSVSNINSTSVTTNSASIFYTLNTNNFSATSNVKYGLTSGDLTSSVTGFNASANTTTPGTVDIVGLQPNIQYFYLVEATNSAGTTQSPVLNFTTLSTQPVINPIAEYNFNSTLDNINGNTPFSAFGLINYVADRNGNANSALSMENVSRSASISNLPVGNSARTVSIWIRPTTITTGFDYQVFRYGNLTTNNTYGFSYTSSAINNFGWANDLIGNFVLQANAWQHIVCTYNAGQATVYVNGIVALTGSKPTWNTILSDFTLRIFAGHVDDLKIYDFALDQSQILQLYNTNTVLSSQNFNQNNLEVTLYPNPVHDILNIETALEVKSIEIYNIQGQKVLSSNQKQINVSDLAAGMYMVRIQDAENNIATKKIVIK